jgi:hypothetical protein
MTPPAATTAARRARAPRPGARPAPRRMSGPLGPRVSAGGSVALPRPRRRTLPPFVGDLLARLRALPEHRLLDRLIGGRTWIPLIAVALAGIVFLQVALLRLNAGIGRAVEQATTLERQNAALRAGNAELSAGGRVRAAAARAGLVDPAAGTPRFLTVAPRDGARAARTMTAPGTGELAAAGSAAVATAPTVAATPTVAAVAPATATAVPTTTTPAATAPATTAPAPTAPATTVPAATAPATTAPTTTATAPGATASPAPATSPAGGAAAP